MAPFPLAVVGVLCVTYPVYLAVHRLFLSPIAKFPGPKWAAVSFAYQFWHDVVRRGQYIWIVQDMHAKYGPIIRINPYELHISDSAFYESLYATGGIGIKRDKWSWDTVGAAGVADSTLSTIDQDLHRVRRSAILPFFSTQNVRKLEPVIQAKVDIAFRRVLDFKDISSHVNLSHLFSAFTNDVIMEYSFARSFHRLEAPDFDPSYKIASHKGVRMAQIAKHLRFLSWITKLLLILPERMSARLGSTFRMFLVERRKLFAEIEALKQESLSYSPDNAHVTVFRELLASKLPPSEKEPKRLAADAQVLVSAGSETTARALTFATFCLLTNSGVLRCLKQELEKAVPTSDPASSISLSQLQNLPYLSGVIKESLRLSYGVAGRLARVRPNEDMKYQSWVIPAGTPVSMTSYDVHHDESVFPDSHFFKPERWIQNPGLERYLVSFGKGTRQCLGMSLAYAEMYLTLGRLFRWLGSGEVRGEEDVGVLELWATDKSDVQMVGEVLVPFVKQGSKGVRAILRS